jgi:hypothetical protein
MQASTRRTHSRLHRVRRRGAQAPPDSFPTAPTGVGSVGSVGLGQLGLSVGSVSWGARTTSCPSGRCGDDGLARLGSNPAAEPAVGPESSESSDAASTDSEDWLALSSDAHECASEEATEVMESRRGSPEIGRAAPSPKLPAARAPHTARACGCAGSQARRGSGRPVAATAQRCSCPTMRARSRVLRATWSRPWYLNISRQEQTLHR